MRRLNTQLFLFADKRQLIPVSLGLKSVFLIKILTYPRGLWNTAIVSPGDGEMACLARLRDDTKFLETTFPRSHRRFQILSATVDEVSFRFIIGGGAGGSDRAGSEPAIETVVFTANFSVRIPKFYWTEVDVFYMNDFK